MKRQIGIEAIIIFLLLSITVLKSQAAEKTVGVLMSSNIPYYRAIHQTFTGELNSKGVKAEVVLQSPASEAMAWVNAARKLGAVGADIIVTYGSPAAQAAISETSNIPVIFAGIYDFGSLGMKGGKVTGITSKVSIAGLLKNLKGINNFSTLGVIYNSSEKDTVKEADEADRLQGQFSFKATKINVKGRGDLSKIKGVDAILITSCVAMESVDEIVSIARKQKILTAALIGGGEDKGIVLTLSADPAEQGREAADMTARVIKGESPSAISVEHPKKIQLIVNLKEATALGFKVPFDILSSATRVIK